jgi:hypothetical protein
MGIKPAYTCQQGRFLAFIHHYTTLHGRPPAEAEIARFFQVTPPSVHSTILTLERRGLITRAPGQARSIALRLPPQELPPLYGSYATTNIPPPARQDEGQRPTDTEAALLRLGKMQLEDWFAHNDRNPLDDSEFIPILDKWNYFSSGSSSTCESRRFMGRATTPVKTQIWIAVSVYVLVAIIRKRPGLEMSL